MGEHGQGVLHLAVCCQSNQEIRNPAVRQAKSEKSPRESGDENQSVTTDCMANVVHMHKVEQNQQRPGLARGHGEARVRTGLEILCVRPPPAPRR
eukprot:15187648-Alexandrium_andersonii.AAC.1